MTIQAVKFKDWNIPKGGRLDPWRIPFKSSIVSPFRLDGGVSLYGRQRKPLSEKIHTTSFILTKGCEADLIADLDQIMTVLHSGSGRLWFNNFSLSGPLLFSEDVQPNDFVWTPNSNNWRSAQIDIEWELVTPTLYRPLTAGYLTQNSYTPVTIGTSTFGESWEERTFAEFVISASPTNIVIENLGHLRTHRVILRLESLGVNGAVNPQIENQTTDQRLKYNGTLTTASHVLQANCAIGAGRVRLSSDSGLSFVNDPENNQVYANCDINNDQGPIMEFEPGTNNLVVTADGAPDFRVLILWQPAYGMVT